MTLAQAQAHLDAWYAADLALATGQEYTIGSRRLTRADWQSVKDAIGYWERKVAQLTAGTTGPTVRRAIPRDL